MAQLTKERDRLTKKISTHRALLDTRAQLLKEKKGSYVFLSSCQQPII